MLQFAEKRVKIELGGEIRVLCFNANTMAAYEDVTSRFYLDTLAVLYDAMKPLLDARVRAEVEAGDGEVDPAPIPPIPISGIDIIRKVPMRELRALVWAALHDYDANDEPSWPLTINQVGRMIQFSDIARLFKAFLQGQSKNSPTSQELGESPAPPTPNANPQPETPRIGATAGGERSIALPVGAFD